MICHPNLERGKVVLLVRWSRDTAVVLNSVNMTGANCLFPTCTNSRYHRKKSEKKSANHFFVFLQGKGLFTTNSEKIFLKSVIFGPEMNIQKYPLNLFEFIGKSLEITNH